MSVEHSYPFKRLVGDVVRPKTLAMPVKRLAGAIIKPINAPKSTVCSEKTPRGLMKRTGKVAKFVDAYVKGHKDATLDDIKEAYRAEYQPKRLPGQIMTYVKQYYAHLVAPKATKSTKAVSEASDCGVFKYPTVAESKAYWKSLKNDSNPGVLSTPIVVQRGNSIIRRRVRDIIDERLAKSMYCEFNAVLTQYMYDFENPNDKEFDYVEKYYHKYINSSKFAVKVDWNVADLNARNQLINYMHANSETYLRSIVEYKWQISEMVEAEYSNAQGTDFLWEAGSVSMSDDCEDSKINQESRNIMDKVLMELVEYCEARELVRWANSKNSWVFKFQEGKNKYGDELTLPRSLFEDCESISELGYKNQIGGDSSESESESESDSDLTEDDGYESDPIFDYGMENICLYCDSRDTWRCNKSKECGCFDCEELWDDTCNECKLSCEEGRCPYHSTEADSGTCETDCDTDDLGSDWDNHDSDYDPDDEGSDSDSDNDVVTPGGFEYYDNAEEKSHVSEIPMNKPITPISGPTESDCDESEFSSDVGSDIDMPFGDTVATYDGYDNEPQIVTDTVTIPEIQYDHVAMYIPPVEVYISDSESEAPIESKLDEIDNGYETPCFDDNGEQIDPTIELGDTPNPQVSAGVAAIMNNVNTNIGQGCWSMISDFVQDFKRAHHYKKVLNQIKTFPKRYEKLSYRRHKFYEYYGFGYMNTRRCVKWEQDANGNIIVINLYDEADIMDQRRTETIPSDQLCDESGLPWDAPHRDFTDFENESESDDDDSDWVEHPDEEYNPIVSDQDLVDRQTVRSAITRAHMIRYGDDWDFDAVDRISEHRMELLESGVSVATILRREVIIHQVHTFPSIDLVNVETVDEPDVLPPVPEMTELTDIERELEEQPEVIYLILTKQPTKKLLGGDKQCDDFRENGCKPNAPKFKKRDRPRFVETMGGVIDTLNDCGPTEYQQHIAHQILAKEMEQVGPIMPLERQTAEPTCYQTEVNYDFNDSLENAAYITYDSPCNGSILIAREQFNKWQNIDDTPRWTFTADSDISELPEFEVDPISGCPMVNMQAFRHWVHLKQYKLGDKRIPKDRTSVADNEAYKHYCELYLCPRRTQKMEKIDQSIIDESFVDTLIAEDWLNYVTCKIDTCPDLVGYLGYGEKASKRVDRIMDLFFKLLGEAKYPQTDNIRKFKIGDLALHIQTKTSKMQRQTCKYCECDQIVYSEQYRVWKCAKCQEVQGGLLGGMLRGRGMQFGNSRSRMQNNRIFNNNGDVRRMQDDAFDAALSVVNGVQAGPIDTDELDADDILAELDAVEQENNQNESPRTLMNQFNAIIDEINADPRNARFGALDRVTSPEPRLVVPDSLPEPFADEFAEVDTIVNAVPAVGSPGRRLAMINFEADQGTVIGFDSSSDSEDRKSDSDFSDFAPLPVIPEERPHADAFANQVMIDNDDFRPVPVPIRRRAGPGLRNQFAEFDEIENPFADRSNDNTGSIRYMDIPNQDQNQPYSPLIGRVILDVPNDQGVTRLEEIFNWFDEIHIHSSNNSFKREFTSNMRNLATTLYQKIGINPMFKKGVSVTQVLTKLKADIAASTSINDDADELDILLGVNANRRGVYTRYVDRAIEFFNNLQVYNLRFKLRDATTYRNQKWLNMEKTVGVILSKQAADRLTRATGTVRRRILQAEILRKMDMYDDETDDFNIGNFKDVRLSRAYDSNYYTQMRMNNGNDVNARLMAANINRFLKKNRGDRESYIRSVIMPTTMQNGLNARELALREWRERTNSSDDQLARFKVPSGDCVCKYIADELNKFFASVPNRKNGQCVRRRILITPQQIANEFIDAGVQNGFKTPGYSADDIIQWAKNCNREWIDVYVYSPHKLRKITQHIHTKRYKGSMICRLGFVPFDNHLYPVACDSYAKICENFDYKKERLSKRLCAVRGAKRLDILEDALPWSKFTEGYDDVPEAIQRWIDGEFETVMYIAVDNLLRVLITVFEQKNIVCDQCCGAGDIHIDTIIHPVTGLALIANQDFEAIQDICDTENNLELNTDLNPMMPEFLNPHTGFSVMANALFLKYLGEVKPVPVDGGLFGDYKKFKPAPLKQFLNQDQRDPDDPWSIALDFKNCYPTCLANNDQDFPLFTKFDEIIDFNMDTDEVNIDYQYFVMNYDLYGYKFASRVVHGRNLKRLLAMFPYLRKNIKSYRKPTRTMPANTFAPVLRKLKEQYPDSYKKIANQFIGNCNRSVNKNVYQYISTEEATVTALQSDIELSSLNDFDGTLQTHTTMHCHTLDDYNCLYRLQITEEWDVSENLSYVYDIVMDNYLTKMTQYLKYFHLIGVNVNYIKVDCFGITFNTEEQRRRLNMLKDCHEDSKGYKPPTFEYAINEDMPPKSDEREWNKRQYLSFSNSLYISGPAGSGKTTRTFKLLAERIKAGLYPYVHCYVTAHQNKTTNDNRIKCLRALTKAGVMYTENIKKRCIYINNITIQFDSVERWRRSYENANSNHSNGQSIQPDHFIIDEISMVNSQQLIALYNYKESQVGVCFTLAGDFDQLPPVREVVYRDIYNSALFKRLCDYNEFNVPLVLGQCRFENQVTIDVLNFFRKHQRLPKLVLKLIKPCDVSLDKNLVYTNRKRDQILREKGKTTDKLNDGDIVVFQNCDKASKDSDPEDQSMLGSSASEAVRSAAKAKGFYVGAEYEIKTTENPNRVRMINPDTKEEFEVSTSFVVSSIVGTVHKAQGSKIVGKGNIWEWNRMDYKMRYTALTRFTDIRNAHINDLASYAVPEEKPDIYCVRVKEAQVKKVSYYRKDDQLICKPFEDKKVPEYVPYSDFMDPDWNAKEEQNRKDYEAKYGTANERVPIYMILRNAKSKELLNQYVSIVNNEIKQGFHYAQCGMNLDKENMCNDCYNDIKDNTETKMLTWCSPFVGMRHGVKHPAREKWVRIRYAKCGREAAMEKMKEQITQILNECTRTQSTTCYQADIDRKFSLSKSKWKAPVDDNIYYARVVDVYDEKDEKHNEIATEAKFFDVEAHKVVDYRTNIRMRHKEYIRMARPLHDEIQAGVVSGIRTFKFGNYRYFNETFDNMARMILTKNKMKSLGFSHGDDSENLYQEICTINSRMYFDIDIPAVHNKDPDTVLKQFLDALEVHFLNMSGNRTRLNKKYVRVCKSTSKKVSYHISVLNEIFPTPDHQRYFTKKLSDYILGNVSRFDQLVYEEDDQYHCAVDCNAYHNKQSVRLVFCNKQGKDNTLLPYKLNADDSLQLVNFDAFNWRQPDSPMNEIFIDKLKEYFICIDQADLWCFSEFSKIENKASKKNRSVSYSKETNCTPKQIKQVTDLMRNVKGFDLSATKAVYDLDGKFVKYIVFRNQEEMCPCCNKKHRRQNGVVQEYLGVWRFTCYQSGNKSIRLCE